MAQRLLKAKKRKIAAKRTADGCCRKAQMKKFEVMLTATLQGTFDVEASDEESAEKILERRWLTGDGGAVCHDDLECIDAQFDVVGGYSL